MHSIIPYSPDLEFLTPNITITSNWMMVMSPVIRTLRADLLEERKRGYVYMCVTVDVPHVSRVGAVWSGADRKLLASVFATKKKKERFLIKI